MYDLHRNAASKLGKYINFVSSRTYRFADLEHGEHVCGGDEDRSVSEEPSGADPASETEMNV